MIGFAQAARSALSLLAVLLWIVVVGTLVLYAVLLPMVWIRPKQRRVSVARYFQLMAGGILALLRLGGARMRTTGRLPTGEPVLIVMNHQSLVDIPTVIRMSHPYIPAFVTRRRYTRFIPVISAGIRLIDGPIVDPRRDPRASVEAVRQAAAAGQRTLLIFPEGHRTLDGEIRPFKTAGLRAILGARRMPVYVVVTDGFWAGRRLVDSLFNIHKIRGETEVLGPFDPPEAEEDIAAFIDRMRDTMIAHLRVMRERHHASV